MGRKIVEIEWIDSNSTWGWGSTKNAKESAKTRPLTCRSVGYFLCEHEDRVSIVQSFADNLDSEDGGTSEVLTVPKVAILKMRNLK